MSSFSGAQYEANDLATTGRNGAATPQATALAAREMDLLRKSRLGDRAAYGQLIVLYRIVCTTASCDWSVMPMCREITQEAFTRGLAKIGQLPWRFAALYLAVSNRPEPGDQHAAEGYPPPGVQPRWHEQSIARRATATALPKRIRDNCQDRPDQQAGAPRAR